MVRSNHLETVKNLLKESSISFKEELSIPEGAWVEEVFYNLEGEKIVQPKGPICKAAKKYLVVSDLASNEDVALVFDSSGKLMGVEK